MFAVLGEDVSHTDSLKTIIRRILNNHYFPVKTKEFEGCGDLINRGHRIMKLFSQEGCTKFIVCYDADGPDPKSRYEEAEAKIVKKSGVIAPNVILIPVHEFEAWIIADNDAMKVVIKTWEAKEIQSPEKIADPKKYLRDWSRGSNKKPRYDPVNHNPKIAAVLDLNKVEAKCPSFRPLSAFLNPH